LSEGNPFPTRPEDILNKGLRAVVGALPVVGSALTEFLAFVIGDPAQERRDDFMKVALIFGALYCFVGVCVAVPLAFAINVTRHWI
jgi:hypothetical protein